MTQQPGQLEAAALLSAMAALCRGYGLSIAHEDGHGAFIVRPWSADDEEHLLIATVEVAPTPEPF